MKRSKPALADDPPAVRQHLLPGELRAHLLSELHTKWRRYRIELARCARKPKRGRVHRSRRLGRELLVRIELMAALDEGGGLRAPRKLLKSQIKALGLVRDGDVDSDLLRELAPHARSVRDCRRWVDQERRKAAEKAMRGLKRRKLERRMREAFRSFSPPAADTHAKRIDDVLRACLARARRRRPPQGVGGRRLHKARAAIRRYRYVIEALEGVLSRSNRADRLRREQSLLGEIHDWDALLARWRDWARRNRVRRAEREKLVATIEAKRGRLMKRVAL